MSDRGFYSYMYFGFQIAYKKFSKNFYEEHEEIQKLKEEDVIKLRHSLGVKVREAHLLEVFYLKGNIA